LRTGQTIYNKVDTQAIKKQNTRESAGEKLFLGIEKSLSEKRWIKRLGDDRKSMAIAQRYGLGDVVARILSNRGVSLDDVDSFLDPMLRDLMPDPSCLKGMDVATERLSKAITNNEIIGIFGDYDVDGATSSALLERFIAAVGGRSETYIPDRLTEGYGPNTPALLKLKELGAGVVITVDCGTSSHDPIKAALQVGLETIVVDHHAAEANLPVAIAVINPNRIDDESGQGQLAAVGVTFLLVVAINRLLRNNGWFKNHQEPDLTQWLDIVALGTICDVVPLIGLNRALVRQGLKVLRRRTNPGLKALSDVAGINEEPGTYHVGFVLGPRINAGGRIGSPDLGSRLLGTNNENEAKIIAQRLDVLNLERREIEASVLSAATLSVEQNGKDIASIIITSGEEWHQGVVGIVASRLVERFNRPACVISIDGNHGVGSGRSISGVDLGSYIIAAKQAGILIKGGGHKMAAGFTVERNKISKLQNFLEQRVAEDIKENGIRPSLYLDGAIKTAAANMNFLETLAQVGPFGSGNPEPRFVIPSAKLAYAAVVGDRHIRGFITDEGSGRLPAISFNSIDTPLGQALLKSVDSPLHIAGRLKTNTWQGKTSAQLHIDDAAPVWAS
jgi:single-stranded-DNA-specific exonuclease